MSEIDGIQLVAQEFRSLREDDSVGRGVNVTGHESEKGYFDKAENAMRVGRIFDLLTDDRFGDLADSLAKTGLQIKVEDDIDKGHFLELKLGPSGVESRYDNGDGVKLKKYKYREVYPGERMTKDVMNLAQPLPEDDHGKRAYFEYNVTDDGRKFTDNFLELDLLDLGELGKKLTPDLVLSEIRATCGLDRDDNRSSSGPEISDEQTNIE